MIATPDLASPAQTVGLAGGFDFMCRGWRPAASWTCVAILALRGVIVPAVELCRGQRVEAPDMMLLAAIAAMLGMSVLRSADKRRGVAS